MSEHLALHHIVLDSTAWIEIAAAFAAYFFLSFLWWGPILGKKWGAEMGIDMSQKPDGKTMGKAMALQIVSTLLMAFVFWHVVTAFTIDTQAQAMSNPSMGLALQGAFYMWLGFIVPIQLGAVAWEKRSWTLVAINAAGHLIGIMAMGAVFALL